MSETKRKPKPDLAAAIYSRLFVRSEYDGHVTTAPIFHQGAKSPSTQRERILSAIREVLAKGEA